MPRNPDKTDYSGGLPAHFDSFEIIEDPRTGGNKRHHFGEILFMATSAMLCGMNGFADKITGMGGDYLLALKGNQGNLHKEAQDHFDFALRQLDLSKAKGWSVSSENEKAHGRITTRTVLTTTSLATFDAEMKAKWPAIASLSVVETESRSTTTGKKGKRERRYYISSRKEDAEYFQQAIRSHWSIENRCHWIQDTAFREDHNQTYTGNAAKNLGTLRRIVLNILHDDPGTVKTVPKKRREAFANRTYRERLLSLA